MKKKSKNKGVKVTPVSMIVRGTNEIPVNFGKVWGKK